MLFIVLIIVIALSYMLMRHYMEEDGRFPPAATRKGKEARLVSIPVIITLTGLLGAQIYVNQDDPVMFKTLVYATIFGGLSTLIAAYWRTRK